MRKFVLCGLLSCGFVTAPAYGQVVFTPGPDNISGNQLCTIGNVVTIADTEDGCDVDNPAVTTITVGPAANQTVIDSLGLTSNGFVSFTDSTQFSGTQAFSGTTTFNSSSVTFNNSITTNGITNTGAISATGALSAGSATITGALSTGSLSVGAGGVTVAAGANVSMGGNQVHNVAAGTAATDAVNLGQLNAVTGNVTALQTTVATHTTQISALQAADAAFDTRIDSLEFLAAELDDRIDKVDDRASAGTAAAVALSGAMFLPGKSFNLTGNVGSYRGAHAASLQFGALVSSNVALNAGIAHGFNKGGKTALRAGFTFGW